MQGGVQRAELRVYNCTAPVSEGPAKLKVWAVCIAVLQQGLPANNRVAPADLAEISRLLDVVVIVVAELGVDAGATRAVHRALGPG